MKADSIMVPEEKKSKRFSGNTLQQLLAFSSLIVLVAFFSIASPNFLSMDNIMGILLSTSVIGILALGATFVIVTSGIDLSVGTVMALSSVMTGLWLLMPTYQFSSQ